jgi:uncharacterized protein YndB with AHSA1/START domain
VAGSTSSSTAQTGIQIGRRTFTELTENRIVLTWGFPDDADLPPGSSLVEITLEPDGSATVVRLEHRGLPESHRRTHDEGWTYFLGRLSSAVR